ncbi:non-ribosomal peptide synthetase [Aquamicrobium sp. LC103]|uniref:non-ribosomal peptide synthetase n=1 Tax=Aquamicrobium sp. LC103 TaxID=1120658 RepID=UPI00069C92BA|nr:non-ribosomal peptide synthetase [Aquamicrobium sp. LC103]
MAAVVDAFEMHPAQAGMLLHTLMEPRSGIYFEQLWCSLDGELDVEAFRAAWRRVIERHDVLRTECHWIDLHRPVQVVYDHAEPEWHIEDWSGLDSSAQDVAFEEWLKADRQRGFRMDEAPLLRFALFRLAGNRHRFVWSFHHLLMDGWCGALLVREMLRLYAGQQPAAAPTPYKHYIDWRAAQDAGAAEAYWRNELAGLDGPTAITIAKGTSEASEAVELRATLSQECAERLRTLSRSRRLTFATILQGAWALLLARYGEQDDVVFGAVQSGRPADLPGAEDMIGLFLNTVPVRVRVDADGKLDSLLEAIQAGQAGRERFGHIGLAGIQRCSGLGATTSLFDTLVIVENYPLGILDAVEMEGRALRIGDAGSHERTNFPLTLRVFPGASVELVLGIDPLQMDPEAARRLLGHYETILNAFCERPDARLCELDMVGAEERDCLLSRGRGPACAVPSPLPHQIVARAEATPGAVAIEFIGEQGRRILTCSELVSRAGKLATTLRERQLDRGAVVAVWMERSPDLIVALLGVMMSGAAYLPIDPDYPDERIDHMLRDAAVGLIVTDAINAGRAERVYDIDVLVPGGHAALAATLEMGSVEPEDMAYLLYTSGSTGRPKGVPISHLNLANLIAAMCERPGIGARDRMLAVTTVGFDIAGLEIFGPLVSGGTLVLTDAATCRDGVRLARLIEETDATVMQATPSGWRMLLNAGWQGKPDLKMLCGGEALDSRLATTLLNHGGELWNMYGPTETTIWSAALKVEPELLEGHAVPVGGAIANTHLLLLDGRGAPVPMGVAGELCIGGLGLSSGYRRRPELTARKFVPNGFCSASYDQAVLYRTGDRARWRADGHIEFLGRMDNQVKLRGHRIELDEIEARLVSFAGVAQALVHVADDGIGARLVAYLKWRDAEPDGAAALLRAHLQTTLPAYMLPAAYVSLAAFPLTPNGKVDRKALPAPGLAPTPPPDVDLRFDEPAASVARIWCDVLDLNRVGPKDNFFEIGGHSLLAVNVQRLIGEQFDVDLPVADLFRFPTLETLAAHLETKLGGDVAAAELPDRGKMRAAGRERLMQRRLSQRPVRV